MSETPEPATLQSIADRLGLHVSTVSRVLNGGPDLGARAASGRTARLIRDTADELGYRPNPHARSLRTRRSNLIGVLVPRLTDLVLATIYEGIDEAAASRGLATFVTMTDDNAETQRARTDMVLARRVDGLIFGDARLDDDFLDHVTAKFVLVNRRAGNHPAVTCDDRLGGRLAADHLLERGHRNVAVIAGEPHASTGVDRTEGFVRHYLAAGAPRPRVTHSHFDTSGGRSAAERLLLDGDPPTAIFAVNDFDAIGAAGAARDRGLRLGEDIAIIGFNDTPIAAELPIPLTSVRSPMREMGARAVTLLQDVLRGKPVKSVLMPPTLIPRASTGAA